MYKVKPQAGTRWPCCHCKSCKTKLEHENKTFYCCCCIAAVGRCRAVLPPACHGLSYYCQGETRGGAWTRGSSLEPGHSLDTWSMVASKLPSLPREIFGHDSHSAWRAWREALWESTWVSFKTSHHEHWKVLENHHKQNHFLIDQCYQCDEEK